MAFRITWDQSTSEFPVYDSTCGLSVLDGTVRNMFLLISIYSSVNRTIVNLASIPRRTCSPLPSQAGNPSGLRNGFKWLQLATQRQLMVLPSETATLLQHHRLARPRHACKPRRTIQRLIWMKTPQPHSLSSCRRMQCRIVPVQSLNEVTIEDGTACVVPNFCNGIPYMLCIWCSQQYRITSTSRVHESVDDRQRPGCIEALSQSHTRCMCDSTVSNPIASTWWSPKTCKTATCQQIIRNELLSDHCSVIPVH